jgi:NADH dehydrogenase FAD-containing subunit
LITSVQRRHRVVVVGGGFGGIYAVKPLTSAPVDVAPAAGLLAAGA